MPNIFLIDKHTENIIRKRALKRQPKAYREYIRDAKKQEQKEANTH